MQAKVRAEELAVKAESAALAKSEFLALMSHELRTPLAIMRARVDTREELPLRRSLEADIVNMTRTVNQVLDIAELEAVVVDGRSLHINDRVT